MLFFTAAILLCAVRDAQCKTRGSPSGSFDLIFAIHILFMAGGLSRRHFFYPKTVGKCGCEGISWRNLFLYCPTCYQPKGKLGNIRSNQDMTLDDLDEFTTTYIRCTTSNQWKRSPSPREAHYEVLTMSSQSIERLDSRQSEGELHGKLMPVDVYLSDVVATSASSLNYHMGGMQGDEELVKD